LFLSSEASGSVDVRLRRDDAANGRIPNAAVSDQCAGERAAVMTKTISITDAVVDYADVEKDVRCYLRRSELRATLRLNALNGT